MQYPQYTPVVPPLPSPEGHLSPPIEPPVIPTMSPQNPANTPAWARPSHPQQYVGGFPVSNPYAQQQYMQQGMPQHPPGSYFVPPVALPHAGPQHTPVAPVGPSGYSTDWTGFPTQGGGPPPGTPWTGHGHGGGPPPQTPYVAAHLHPHTGYTTFQQPLPPQGYAFAVPAAPPAWGPAPGGFPGATPWGPPAAMPAWPQQTPYNAPGVFAGPPHQPAAPREPARPARPEGMDKFDKFSEEIHYGPVLESFLVKVTKAKLELNPLLMPPPDHLAERAYLKWNMLFPTGQCQRSTDPPHRSWSAGRQAPATWPRVKSLRLVSRAFPWDIEVAASEPTEGVTCGDVLESIAAFMYGRISSSQLEHATPRHKKTISAAYYHNRSTAPGVPGGRLPGTMLRCDWLGADTLFGGIVADERCVREVCGGVLPCTFELVCVKSYRMSEEEMRENEAREADADAAAAREARRRTRSRATSRATSRASSRPPPE